MTGVYTWMTLWSTLETLLGVICACLPSIPAFLVRLFPRYFSGAVSDPFSNAPSMNPEHSSNSHDPEQRQESYLHRWSQGQQSGGAGVPRLEVRMAQHSKKDNSSEIVPLVDVLGESASSIRVSSRGGSSRGGSPGTGREVV